MMSQSENLPGSHARTMNSAALVGIGDECFWRTVSQYRLPADLSDAPNATRSGWG